MTGDQVQPAEIHQNEVGVAPGGDPPCVPAQGPGAVHRGHAQGVHGQEGQGILLCAVLEHGGNLHVLKEVGGVVGRNTVGPQCHVEMCIRDSYREMDPRGRRLLSAMADLECDLESDRH